MVIYLKKKGNRYSRLINCINYLVIIYLHLINILNHIVKTLVFNQASVDLDVHGVTEHAD